MLGSLVLVEKNRLFFQFLRKGNGEKKKSTDCKVLLFLIGTALGVVILFLGREGRRVVLN